MFELNEQNFQERLEKAVKSIDGRSYMFTLKMPKDRFLDKEQIMTACKKWQENNAVTHVSMGECGLTDEDLDPILEALEKKQGKPVQSLSLPNNKIGKIGLEKLAEFIQNNESLSTIVLDGNFHSHESREILDQAAKIRSEKGLPIKIIYGESLGSSYSIMGYPKVGFTDKGSLMAGHDKIITELNEFIEERIIEAKNNPRDNCAFTVFSNLCGAESDEGKAVKNLKETIDVYTKKLEQFQNSEKIRIFMLEQIKECENLIPVIQKHNSTLKDYESYKKDYNIDLLKAHNLCWVCQKVTAPVREVNVDFSLLSDTSNKSSEKSSSNTSVLPAAQTINFLTSLSNSVAEMKSAVKNTAFAFLTLLKNVANKFCEKLTPLFSSRLFQANHHDKANKVVNNNSMDVAHGCSS